MFPPPLCPPGYPLYKRLKARAKQHLLVDWGSNPAPEYYPYPMAIRPHRFMGLGKFMAYRIHQMRSGKSYLAANTSWENPNPDTTCPHCCDAPQCFEYAMLVCLSSARQRSHLLQGVSDLGWEAPIWSDQQMLISVTILLWCGYLCNR